MNLNVKIVVTRKPRATSWGLLVLLVSVETVSCCPAVAAHDDDIDLAIVGVDDEFFSDASDAEAEWTKRLAEEARRLLLLFCCCCCCDSSSMEVRLPLFSWERLPLPAERAPFPFSYTVCWNG